jgi:CheY-like chemotaxis protein
MVVVLVVDDEKDERELICSWLHDAGYEVRSAASGEAGMEMFSDLRVDLALVDMFMPGIGGIRTIQAMREMAPHTPIIAMSGFLHESLLADVERIGAGSLEKPFSPDMLLQRVTECMKLNHNE